MNAACLMLCLLVTAPPRDCVWEQLPALPDKEGFAGAFAGVSNDALLVAGGANFPDKKPWQGGKKVWYETVFVLEKPTGEWKVAGKLPRPLGYGVSVSHGGSVICVGGSDAERHYASVFRLRWRDGRLATESLPDLPRPIANACGVLVDDVLYVIGGQESPLATVALKSVYRLNLRENAPKWQEAQPLPSAGRVLAVAASSDGVLWVAGGAELSSSANGSPTRRYLRDVFRFDPQAGWKRIADMPYPVVAAASPAPSDEQGFLVLGGDDGSQLTVEPNQHRGFRTTMLRYDARADKWREDATMPIAPVTLTAVRWQGAWILPSGEVRPGLRTPAVWRWQPHLQEQ